MQPTFSDARKAHRFSDVDTVSKKIFEEIVPDDSSDEQPAPPGNRVRTRLLNVSYYFRDGWNSDKSARADMPCARDTPVCAKASHTVEIQPTYGWLVVVDGPGRGVSFALSKDVSTLGRGEDQDISLAFGDAHISRMNHATIHFEKERGLVALRCGGKRNPVLLNGRLLSGTRLLKHTARITVGQTTLRFVSIDAIDEQGSFWAA